MKLEIFKYLHDLKRVSRISIEVKDENIQKDILNQLEEANNGDLVIHRDEKIMVFLTK